jgi:hypothetical protein
MSSSELHVDGTFEVEPLLYKQMYNIAGEISVKILPLLNYFQTKKKVRILNFSICKANL